MNTAGAEGLDSRQTTPGEDEIAQDIQAFHRTMDVYDMIALARSGDMAAAPKVFEELRAKLRFSPDRIVSGA